MLLVTYDVDTADLAGERRLRKVARVCVSYGQRVQNSVFECVGDASVIEKMKSELLSVIDTDKDSLRFYNLGNGYHSKIEHHGAKPSYDAEGFLAL